MFVWYHFLKIHASVVVAIFLSIYATQRLYKSYRKKNYLMKYSCFLPQKPVRMLRLLPGFKEELLDRPVFLQDCTAYIFHSVTCTENHNSVPLFSKSLHWFGKTLVSHFFTLPLYIDWSQMCSASALNYQ